jgi:Xaa-Pro aminopeptidase
MEARLDKLAESIAALGADAAFFRNTPDIEWVCGFEHAFDEERAHALFVDISGDVPRAILHTDSRYSLVCSREATRLGSAIEVCSDCVSHAKWVYELMKGRINTTEEDKLACEDTLTLREFKALKLAFAEGDSADVEYVESPSPFLITKNLCLDLRAVKDADEIAKMRAAQAITDAAFTWICSYIASGKTELEVSRALDNKMFELGADALAFPTIVACGANGASPHAQPGSRVLERGQCVVMDFGAKKDGYCSDMTRTVFLGEPRGRMARAWHAICDANAQVRAMLKPGVTGIEAHNLAEEVLAEAGFGGCMGHGLGHGVGLEIHEEPCLNMRNSAPLVAGNVVTVEPGIYIEGECGMRLEDFGVVTESGFETFTESTHEIVVL